MSELIPYKPPEFQNDGFNCAFCNAYSDQLWGQPHFYAGNAAYGTSHNFWICRCSRCEKFSIWLDQKLIYPATTTAPPPNTDITADIADDYNEARDILSKSPRGATALLRLCIQKLCKHLGEPGKNINDDIASLVQKGLSPKVQKALDIVRVVGNNAVHPGQIDLKDDIETANRLFGLFNLIADVMITQPKQVDALYESVVPDAQKDAIERRDDT